MKRNKKVVIIAVLLLMSFLIVHSSLAENSATYSVSCRVPVIISLANGKKVITPIESKTNIQNQKQTSSILEENSEDLIEVVQTIVSQDKQQTILITTVCAR